MWKKLFSNSGLILLAILAAGIWTSNLLSLNPRQPAAQQSLTAEDRIRIWREEQAKASPSPTPQLSCVELYQQRKDKEFIERCSLQERSDIYDVMSKAEVELSKRAQDPRATAICADGTYSYSANRRGTCSHHGGVAQWLSR